MQNGNNECKMLRQFKVLSYLGNIYGIAEKSAMP
jgi:hypothetical protein